jgi:hypothetical protein
MAYLDTGVSNGRSTQIVERITSIPLIFRQDERLGNQDTLVTSLVHAKGESANLVGALGSDPVLDELGNTAAQAGSQTARSHHGHVHVLASEGEISRSAHGG